MAAIRVRSSLDTFAADVIGISKKLPVELRGVVRQGIKVGNSVAKDFARQSSGTHGKRYPSAFSYEMRPGFRGAGSDVYAGEYGPDISKDQGGMSFEWGSRNQPPHLDLNKSADIIGPALAGETLAAVDRVFW